MVTDTMTRDLDANDLAAREQAEIEIERQIVDVRPIDEFGPDLRRKKPFSMIDDLIERNKAKRDQLKEENRNLRSFPDDDVDYEDGTVLIWHTDSEWGDRHYAAVKEDGRWYVSGHMHGCRWDELVATHLKKFHYSEVEVVVPAAA
jgi:hypothetical protein